MTMAKDIKRIKAKTDDIGILTLYLNTDASENRQNGEWKIHLKNGMKELKDQVKDSENPEEKKALKKLLEQAETRIEENRLNLQKSYFLTASADGKLWEEKILQVPVTTSFHWSTESQTGQLEALDQRFPETGIIVIQQRDVAFIETALGEILGERHFSWDLDREDWVDYDKSTPPVDRATGKDEFQRRFDENRQRWYKNLVPRLSKEIKERNLDGAYLVGSREAVAELEPHMSPAHLRGTVTKNLGSMPSHEIVKEVYDTLI
ncbi:VLRF1 family aeRF1-type release factor [Salinicoccus luteus]|uniref:VLRF1 family aeRF1-type release factor n=1 Tax=Salinicoccus luteus TaxID=367840 RepID=UPI0004E1A300|nr:VLRF1 family aeRF1-type release factor [Salinicoccus luteus]